jgi:serine/threonine-protein kinase
MDDQNAAAEAEEATLPAGTKLSNKYEIVRLLGQGGMGAVYEGVHTEMGKRVAIKTLAPSVAEIPGARQRFVREAQLTSRVRHPHIVDVSDVGTDGRTAYIVMELLRGEDLSQRLARVGVLSPRELADVLLPVCSALVAAHEATIVHRDLKPQNIFLATGPHGVEPKVLDFGISKSADALSVGGGLTRTGSVMGTPFYLAPEQIQDARAADAASDQYALGVILYECLAGARPFGGESLFQVFNAIVNERPPALATRRADLPPVLCQIVERAMAAKAAARFPSVRALGAALLPFASPKAQIVWSEAFGAEAVDPAALAAPIAAPSSPTPTPPPFGLTPTPPPVVATPAPAGRTSAGGFAATTPYGVRATPAPEPPRGSAAGLTAELGPMVVPSPSRKPLVIGLVVVAAIGAVVALALRPGPTPAPVVAPAPVVESKPAPAPAAPPPPAAAAPAPEPVAPAPEPKPVEAAAPPPPTAEPKPEPKQVKEVSATRRRSSSSSSRKREPAPAAAPEAPRRSFNPNGAPIID